MPVDLESAVVRNRDLGLGNFLVELDAPVLARTTSPGQFFMIGIPGSDLLLRRPFSVCALPGTFDDSRPGSVEVLYRVAGRGTALLASLKPGAPVNVLGPLGRGFGPVRPGARTVAIAGGIGSAPFPALIARLPEDAPRPWMIYGARRAGDLPLLSWFRERCDRVEVTTEDGSAGVRGMVVDVLDAVLDEHAGPVHLSACGPMPMLRAVALAARARGVECEMSLEARMACGFGVCLGCVVPVRGAGGEVAYERCCVEGPVMPAERVAW